MTYTLTGYPAILVCLLAILGGMNILTGIESWLLERIKIDLRPLWHVIPRRFKLSVRWDRPGAMVTLGDGREGSIVYLLEHDDAPCPIVLVQPYDDNDDPDLQRPEWLPLTSLSPAHRRPLAETLRAMRGKENA